MKQVLSSLGIVLLILGFGMVFYGFKDVLISFNTPVDIYNEYPSDYSKVKAVETNIELLMECFCEEETTTKKDGAITARTYDYYYIIPVFTKTETYYAAVKVNSRKAKPYNKLSDATYAYLSGETEYLDAEPIEFQGGFFKMEDDVYEYFEEWFVENEYFENQSDLDKYLLPLVLEPVNYSSVRKSFIVACVLVSIGLFVLFFGFRSEKKVTAPTKNMITINEISYPATNFIKVNSLIEKGKSQKAITELQKTINIDATSATYIIQHWNEYWN